MIYKDPFPVRVLPRPEDDRILPYNIDVRKEDVIEFFRVNVPKYHYDHGGFTGFKKEYKITVLVEGKKKTYTMMYGSTMYKDLQKLFHKQYEIKSVKVDAPNHDTSARMNLFYIIKR